MTMQIDIPVLIDDADFAMLGETDAERAQQLNKLVNSNLDELMRFYKFIKDVRNCTHAPQNTKGSKAPTDSPQHGPRKSK